MQALGIDLVRAQETKPITVHWKNCAPGPERGRCSSPDATANSQSCLTGCDIKPLPSHLGSLFKRLFCHFGQSFQFMLFPPVSFTHFSHQFHFHSYCWGISPVRKQGSEQQGASKVDLPSLQVGMMCI